MAMAEARVSDAQVEAQLLQMPAHWRWLTPKRVMYIFSTCNLLNYLDREIIPGAPLQFESFVHNTQGVDVTNESVYIGYFTSAFIASYAGAILIIGNLVPKVNKDRTPFTLMGYGLAVWCVAVFLSGLAKLLNSFWLLLFARALSGVGEASFQVIAPPFIDDYAPPGDKVLWLSIFFTAIPVGSALGYGFGSAVANSSLGWGWAFWIEGMLMVPFMLLCFKLPYRLVMPGCDPPGGAKFTATLPGTTDAAGARSSQDGSHSESSLADGGGDSPDPPRASLLDEARIVFSSRIFVMVALGYAAYTGVTMGVATYGPTFLQGLQFFASETEASFVFGAVLAAAGLLATPLGGALTDRLAARNTREGASVAEQDRVRRSACLCLMASSMTLALVLVVAAVRSPSKGSFLGLLFLGEFFLFMPTACITMATLSSVPAHVRPSAIAFQTLMIHVLGDVPTPIIVGLLKDSWAPNCSACAACQDSVLAKAGKVPKDFPTACDIALITKFCPDESQQMAALNPRCPEDTAGMRNALTATVLWLVWAVLAWGRALWLNGGLNGGLSRSTGTMDAPLLGEEVEVDQMRSNGKGMEAPTAL